MRKIFLIITFLSASLCVFSQELNCQVTVISDAKLQLSNTEQDILVQMKQTVFDFMNNTKWTKDKFNIEINKL